MNRDKEIKGFFEKYGEVGIALSGGVDSCLLLYYAVKYAKKVKAYFVKSQFQPEFELEDAKKICKCLNIDICVIKINVLDDQLISMNNCDRCYYCKKNIFGAIKKQMSKDGIKILLEGTNASDDISDRPGYRALQELNVLSPLREIGFTKKEIREQAKNAGLHVFSKPSYACLATRVPADIQLTQDVLIKIEKGEQTLFEMGFTDFRIRLFNNAARIQIKEEQLELLFSKRVEILEKLNDLFEVVVLDLTTR